MAKDLGSGEILDVIAKALGCASQPACESCRASALPIYKALAARFLFSPLKAPNEIDPQGEEARDLRLNWLPACRRIARRLKGEIVVEPISADLASLAAMTRSLQEIFPDA